MKMLMQKFNVYFKVANVLIFVNIIFFVIANYVAYANDIEYNRALLFMGAEFMPAIVQGELWRIITHAFLHGNIIHLLVNIWALWNIGHVVETFYGRRKLILVYIYTAITGSMFSLGYQMIQILSVGNANDGFSISIGASGALFGLVGLIIGNKFKNDTYSVRLDNYIDMNQLLIFVVYNIFIGFGINVFGTAFNINNWAHIGGFIGGIIIGSFLEPINSLYVGKFKKTFEQLLFVVAIILLVVAFIAHYFNYIFVIV
jgi:rhomboid protease GluP